MKKQVIKDALWVDVDGLTVLRNGRIFDNNYRGTGKVRELKQSDRGNGYLRFTHNGKSVSSHRFIAEAFISNPDNLPQINHKSESRKDQNDVLSLEWCDAAYNTSYGTRNERIGTAMTNGKTSKKVYQYALDGTFIREWPSTHEVQRQLGYGYTHISRCCLGKMKTSHGFRWSYDPPANHTR